MSSDHDLIFMEFGDEEQETAYDLSEYKDILGQGNYIVRIVSFEQMQPVSDDHGFQYQQIRLDFEGEKGTARTWLYLASKNPKANDGWGGKKMWRAIRDAVGSEAKGVSMHIIENEFMHKDIAIGVRNTGEWKKSKAKGKLYPKTNVKYIRATMDALPPVPEGVVNPPPMMEEDSFEAQQRKSLPSPEPMHFG